ncbi:MAG: RNA polymerase sigma factor [Clostridiales bacterium]|nr:RNA polymerase sigma factor [Clostridiales bacterium]
MTDFGASSYHRYLQGDSSALEDLVREYGDTLVRFCYSFLNDYYSAEDVMEETFATLIVKRKKFSERAKFKTYLFKIARNKCIDILRSRNRTVELNDNLNDLLSDSPESTALLSDRNKQLYKCMLLLPEAYRQVLILVYFEDFSVEETGKVLYKNRKQIYNLLSRARASLKEILIKEGINSENI